MKIELTYLEIDLPYCANNYGESPCTAQIGVTGDQKCFNTRNFTCDCQDPANYSQTALTLRFGIDNGYLPDNIPCIPALVSVTQEHPEIYPGEKISKQAAFKATLKNFLSSGHFVDKYASERGYNQFEQGTFWGRFFSQNIYLENIPIRVLRGELGLNISQFDVYHYVWEKYSRDNNGNVVISGVDFMRLLYQKTALAPAPSQGYLSTSITAVDMMFTLSPAGIGDKYPASGFASFGEEIVSYTRSGDTFTVMRGQQGTAAQAHNADEIFQECLIYDGQTAAFIVDDLVVNYSPLDSSYTDLSAWNAIVSDFSDVLYSAIIPKPTEVATLLDELIEQAGLNIYGDNQQQEIIFDVLRPAAPTSTTLTEEKIIKDSLRIRQEHRKRFDNVLLHYDQKDSFKNQNDVGNYYSHILQIPPGGSLYATKSLREIFSRWIKNGSRSVAENVTQRIIAQYQHAPRGFDLEVPDTSPVRLGDYICLTSPLVEDCFGNQELVKAIVTKWVPTGDRIKLTLQEFRYDENIVEGERVVDIVSPDFNVNLRDRYDAVFAAVDLVNKIRFVVREGADIGSINTTLPSLVSGDWPSGVDLELEVRAPVDGHGGDATDFNGESGGPAFVTTVPIAINNITGFGRIAGGGGGGGSRRITEDGDPTGQASRGGGGGAGNKPGKRQSGEQGGGGSDGGRVNGGNGGFQDDPAIKAGDGGDLGQPGEDDSGVGSSSNAGVGGAAGTAIDGESFITYINEGDIRGPRIN